MLLLSFFQCPLYGPYNYPWRDASFSWDYSALVCIPYHRTGVSRLIWNRIGSLHCLFGSIQHSGLHQRRKRLHLWVPNINFDSLFHSLTLLDSAAASLIWMNLEYNLGLVAGSLSSLRPLFNIQSFWSTHNDSTNRTPGRSSQHGTSKKGYELQSGDNWRGKGIMKTSEITTVVEDHQDGMSKTSSQERIVPKWGQERTVP